MTEHTNWLPGVLVLAAGLVVAVAWVLMARRKGNLAAAPVDETLANLDQRAQTLIAQLKELQQDRHLLSDAQFAEEKAKLEKAAADALREKDVYLGKVAQSGGASGQPSAGSASAAQAPAPAGGFSARHPQLAGALWGGGVVLFFVAVGLLLNQSATPRGDNGVMTGTTPPGMGNGAQPAQGPMAAGNDPELEAAINEVRSHPENVQLAAEVSHVLIRNQDFATAEELVNRSIGADPFNGELRVHRAFLRATKGDLINAKAELERLADQYPDASEGLLFLGMIALTSDQKPEALAYLERYAAEVPAGQFPPHLADGIYALRREVNGK